MKVTTVTASVRDARFGHRIADWVNNRLTEHHHIKPLMVDLLDVALPFSLPGTKSQEIQILERALDDSDAFIFITPEYNHGYPASLKNFIDTFTTPWRAKPFSFVSYGGQAGGLRAVEQLRPIISELHGVPIRDVVSLRDPWECLDQNGLFTPGDRSEHGLSVMLGRLDWWADALRIARERCPYE